MYIQLIPLWSCKLKLVSSVIADCRFRHVHATHDADAIENNLLLFHLALATKSSSKNVTAFCSGASSYLYFFKKYLTKHSCNKTVNFIEEYIDYTLYWINEIEYIDVYMCVYIAIYRQIFNIKRALAGNKIVDHIFILDLSAGFNVLGKADCKTRRETFKFRDLY